MILLASEVRRRQIILREVKLLLLEEEKDDEEGVKFPKLSNLLSNLCMFHFIFVIHKITLNDKHFRF